MPTGYTSYINDGKITSGKEFLKLCTRAFGIAVDLKDESLDVPTPNYFEPDHDRIIAKALLQRQKQKLGLSKQTQRVIKALEDYS